MNLSLLEMPDDPAQRASWLERQLVGLTLGDLVAQLMIAPAAAQPRTLDDLLGSQLPAVLERGLGVLSDAQLAALLSHPAVLLDLQERIFIEGGPYWNNVPRTGEHTDVNQRIAVAVAKSIAEGATSVRPSAPQVTRRWAVTLAIAAAVMVAAGTWTLWPATKTPWGFNRPGMLAKDMAPAAYLRMLADAAAQWKKQQPTTPEALRQRLQQFRNGCTTLLAADHHQLADGDKLWLVASCTKWRGEIDRLLMALDGGASVEDTRAAADGLAERMRGLLEERADEVG